MKFRHRYPATMGVTVALETLAKDRRPNIAGLNSGEKRELERLAKEELGINYRCTSQQEDEMHQW